MKGNASTAVCFGLKGYWYETTNVANKITFSLEGINAMDALVDSNLMLIIFLVGCFSRKCWKAGKYFRQPLF